MRLTYGQKCSISQGLPLHRVSSLERRLSESSAASTAVLTYLQGCKVIAYARKQAKKSRKQQHQNADDDHDSTTTRILLENLEQGLPEAPPPGIRSSRRGEASPGDIYPVFAPQPPPANAPWRWDEADEGPLPSSSSRADDDVAPNANPDVPRWNPRTGFMRTAAEMQQGATDAAAASSTTAFSNSNSSNTSSSATANDAGAAAAVAPHDIGDVSMAAASISGSSSSFNSSSSNSRNPSSSVVNNAAPLEISLTVPSPIASASGTESIAMAAAPLPPASRTAVLTAALGSGFWMVAIALFFRNYASLYGAASMGTDPEAVAALLRWPAGLESYTDVAAALGAAAAVTGARLALMSVWSELREATERSNAHVLTRLGPLDVLLVAAVSGIPEELLFRGALMPATWPDWRGVALAAVVFGALHNSGGRNPAFAVWASAVGGVYGCVYLLTGNVWVPAVAHVAANAASAFIWKAKAGAGVGLGEGKVKKGR